jgi:multidrug efflux pump subunit AcrA (membrane-fusion protein)
MNNTKTFGTTDAHRYTQIFFERKSVFIRVHLWLIVLLLAGCSHKAAEIPDMTDAAVVEPVAVKNLAETVPAYGIVSAGALEVNIEAEDSSRVQPGQKALAWIGSGPNPIDCQVTSILRNVNTVTGQAIAWLKPVSSVPLPTQEFVSADITIGVHHQALSVPREAVLIKDGKTFLIQEQKGEDGKVKYLPVEVKLGMSSNKDTEILSGLKVGDSIVAKAGIGYLFPNFKQSGDD